MGLLLFGVAKDIAGRSMITLPDGITTVGDLKTWLLATYPGLQQLNSLMIAVNREYAADNQLVAANDEIAVIPPVSGG
ncbi:molybdopterin synthase sulfur carrier subunit [Chitinophaga dinghuensis]|uniref:Molybdopterin synthase sulfur carrier subunit n=1 Tax=Chitinophaga dinghuensis TaxID=1539050 RepID=A0A327VP06_9BACT|nr:molybdopterin converting factor subunit 1 [Chitinophaga dinghuensis]RAJ75189.1 molybdopterin synthase sulfur carrier subunit [Chitinophaga dinghuensis]